MAIETFTHAYNNKVDETILCGTKEEMDRVLLLIPQTFSGYEYTVTHKQLMKTWRIRISAKRKPQEQKQKEVIDDKHN